MRMRVRCLVVTAVVFGIALGAPAQSTGCTQVVQGISYVGAASGTNLPFSGTMKTTFEQRLPDGNAIHAVVRTRDARDSAGRTMMEMAQGCAMGEDGQMHPRVSVQVNDPVARTNMNWMVGPGDQQKTVTIFHQPAPISAQQRTLTPEEQARQQKAMQSARAAQLERRKETKTEDLGVKQINGITAHGSRTTRTIPAGEEGNDQPLVVVNERWESRDLNLSLYVINDDPRRGRTTAEFEDFMPGEPDPALFTPPVGYTVQERSVDGAIIQR
jgi:hypothetical protein